MRNLTMSRPLVNLLYLDRVNAQLASARSVASTEAYTATERAWFRAPVKGGK